MDSNHYPSPYLTDYAVFSPIRTYHRTISLRVAIVSFFHTQRLAALRLTLYKMKVGSLNLHSSTVISCLVLTLERPVTQQSSALACLSPFNDAKVILFSYICKYFMLIIVKYYTLNFISFVFSDILLSKSKIYS